MTFPTAPRLLLKRGRGMNGDVTTMKYATKKKRLVAIFDAYCAKFKKTAATMEEVAEWALIHGLYPCPRKGDANADCEAWERRLDKASVVSADVSA